MERIEEFVDERQGTWCIHCTRSLHGLETNEDHVPTKGFLNKPRPHHLPVVRICRECNSSFSLDEQYAVVFLSCVISGSTDPLRQKLRSASRGLAESPALRERIERSRREFETLGGATRQIWEPDVERFERVILKNARGHVYFELGEPMLEEHSAIWMKPIEFMADAERDGFNGLPVEGAFGGWPEVGSRMMTRLVEGTDMSGGWVVVHAGAYRYRVMQDTGGVTVQSVIHEYLATEVRWTE